MSDPTLPPKQIVVRREPYKELIEQTLRVGLLGLFAYGLGMVAHSETVGGMLAQGAAQPIALAAGFLATWVFAMLKLVKDHHERRRLARMVPDEIAVVKGDDGKPVSQG